VDLTVIKVGGRLGRRGHLRTLASRLGALGDRHRLLVVPGGGGFADAVRELDAREHLGDSAAHWMAVLAMDQYGLALADFIPGSRVVRSRTEALGVGVGDVPVLLPYAWLRRADPLPHSWSVTSDAIAVWVGRQCRARAVVLLKDRAGMQTPLRAGERPLRGGVTVAELAAWDGVDAHVASLVEGLRADVFIIDGGAGRQLEELLDEGRCDGVSVRRSAP
jgi:aspartokinase-like uncharacterized kinase